MLSKMKKILALLAFFPLSLVAQLNIAGSYPYIGALTQTVGGEDVKVTVVANGNWDPHFIIPRPSLFSK